MEKSVTLRKNGAEFGKICYIFPLDNMRDLWDNKDTKGKRDSFFSILRAGLTDYADHRGGLHAWSARFES